MAQDLAKQQIDRAIHRMGELYRVWPTPHLHYNATYFVLARKDYEAYKNATKLPDYNPPHTHGHHKTDLYFVGYPVISVATHRKMQKQERGNG